MQRADSVFVFPGSCSPSGPGKADRHYHIVPETPIGQLAVVYAPSPLKIHQIRLPIPRYHSWEDHLPSSRFRESTCREVLDLAGLIVDYLGGSPEAPGPVPWNLLHTDDLSALQMEALRATARVPFGETASYKAIACAIGRPRACRFVGTAMANNPFPLLIPCHRIIRADGSLGEFGGGKALKKWLLAMEESAT